MRLIDMYKDEDLGAMFAEYEHVSFYSEPTQITPRLWISGEPTKDTLAALEMKGLKFVLNVAAEVVVPKCAAGILIMHLPFNDGHPMDPVLVEMGLREMRNWDMPRCGTLVNCGCGISRSSTMIALYWLATGKMQTFEAAVALLTAKRSVVRPNDKLITPEVMEMVQRLKREWVR